jgi:hypothetical protein
MRSSHLLHMCRLTYGAAGVKNAQVPMMNGENRVSVIVANYTINPYSSVVQNIALSPGAVVVTVVVVFVACPKSKEESRPQFPHRTAPVATTHVFLRCRRRRPPRVGKSGLHSMKKNECFTPLLSFLPSMISLLWIGYFCTCGAPRGHSSMLARRFQLRRA